ncbi:MAG: hypothetical protein V7K35_07330 [Nostoc sp.]
MAAKLSKRQIWITNFLIIKPTPDQNHWIFKPEAIATEILLSLLGICHP